MITEDIAVPTGEPLLAPLAVETARWYAVSGVEDVPDAQGRLFRPHQVKVWERPFRGWVVVIYGHRSDGGGRAAKVFAADREPDLLPDWARGLLGAGAPGVDEVMERVERYADSWFAENGEAAMLREDIERRVTALAAAAPARPAVDLRAHAGLGMPCEVCPGACVVDQGGRP